MLTNNSLRPGYGGEIKPVEIVVGANTLMCTDTGYWILADSLLSNSYVTSKSLVCPQDPVQT